MYWNKDEDRYLMHNYEKCQVSELASALNRSIASVRWRLHELRLVKTKRWTESDLKYLKDNYATTINQELADKLGRTRLAVVDKACKLGLEKDEAFLYDLHKRQNSGQFVKGFTTWNKGGKMPEGFISPSWFKKGQTAWNKLPDDVNELILVLRKLKRKLNGKRLQ